MTTFPQQCSQIANGISQDLFGVATGAGIGVYRPPIFVYNVYPQNRGAIILAPVQNVVANVSLTLNNAVVAEKGGYSIAETGYLVSMFFSTSSGANFSQAGILTITGIDNYFNIVQEQLTFTTGTNYVESVKTYVGLISAVSSVTLAEQCSIVNGFVIGIPHHIPRFHTQFISLMYNNASFLITVPVVAGQSWRGQQPSLTTNDAHGTIDLNGDYVANALLTMCYVVGGARSDLQHMLTDPAATAQQKQLAQELIYANTASNPIVNVPVLTRYDEIGIQYPGNMAAFNAFPTA